MPSVPDSRVGGRRDPSVHEILARRSSAAVVAPRYFLSFKNLSLYVP